MTSPVVDPADAKPRSGHPHKSVDQMLRGALGGLDALRVQLRTGPRPGLLDLGHLGQPLRDPRAPHAGPARLPQTAG
ncbi:hypothetical protein ACFCXT_13735 [Streptomyces vinaceus]|uniref:hypothetical protein n=1 Tax=Streptomyces vinaceus TaxID=1960 RepID=UPI0035DCE316